MNRVPTMREIAEYNAQEEALLRMLVQPLCERHGYGRMMQLISGWWAQKDPIGALTVGPCIGQKATGEAVQKLLKRKRRAP